MNKLLITELKYECDDFANKLMDMFKGVRVEFSVYDENERFQDAMKDEVTIEEQAQAKNVTEETIRGYGLKAKVKRLREMGYKITKEGE
jgi:hypothetical protein